MRYIIIVFLSSILIFSLYSNSVWALTFGLKGGLNNAKYDCPSCGSTFGFIGGGRIIYEINNVLAVQPEVLFSMKGWLWEFKPYRYRMNYLEFPVLMRISVFPLERIRPSLLVGPAFAVKIYGEETYRRDSLDLGLVLAWDITLYNAQVISYTIELRNTSSNLYQVLSFLVGFSF